ncbi:MAG TPA: Bug family tripartite tricarboxylate transporter substrate binding protein [Burkholderiales bacterium]|nr:Bug family tripartite tricarboxylate transporter substrate binding protein [Burkholderiales bacterium]
MISRRALLLGAGAAALGAKAWAQTTQKTMRIIVPFPAGGGTDVLCRIVAEKMRENYAPVVIVENRVGASGRTGVEAVKNAEADGTTLLFTPDFLMTVYPHSFKKLSYDPLKDFIPIAMVARSGLGFAAGPALPAEVKTVRDYVAWAKGDPKRAFYATTSAGGTPHFVGVMLARDAKIELSPVHYKGGAPALQDMMGGQIPVSINPISELLPHLQGGKVRLLAVTSPQRSKYVPDVPTMAEAGFPNIVINPWLGFFAPAKTPPEIVKRLANGIADASAFGDSQRSFIKMGMEPVAMTPVGFAAVVKEDIERWGPIVKASGFTAED